MTFLLDVTRPIGCDPAARYCAAQEQNRVQAAREMDRYSSSVTSQSVRELLMSSSTARTTSRLSWSHEVSSLIVLFSRFRLIIKEVQSNAFPLLIIYSNKNLSVKSTAKWISTLYLKRRNHVELEGMLKKFLVLKKFKNVPDLNIPVVLARVVALKTPGENRAPR